MESPMKQYFRWHSLPTTLSRSQVASSLRDSSCASDDVSDLSLETINTALTNISSTFPEPGIPIPHTPKLHFKSPDSIYDFNKVAFDYETDGSREAAVEHVENSEHPSRYSEISPTSDDIFTFEDSSYDHLDSATSLYDPCDSASDLDEFEDFEDFEESSRAYDVDDVDFDDASHIAFENSVRFDTDVLYIESTELGSEVQDDAEEGCEMTIHEMMMMMMSAEEHRKVIVDDEHHDDNHDSDDPEETVIANMIIEQLANDYPRDMVEIDRQIFIAFVNGIQGDTRQKYQARLHDRVQGFRQGRFQSPFFENETDSSGCLFLDEALKHVIGMFRHIVPREEFEELSRIAQSYDASDQISSTQIHSSNFLARIERLLSERLLDGIMSIGENELSFFADGVVYALGHPKIYMYDAVSGPQK